MGQLGRHLLVLGGALVLFGLLLLAADRAGLGKLPGDFVLRRKHTTFYFPLATSLLLSVVLTIVLNLLLRRK